MHTHTTQKGVTFFVAGIFLARAIDKGPLSFLVVIPTSLMGGFIGATVGAMAGLTIASIYATANISMPGWFATLWGLFISGVYGVLSLGRASTIQ